MPNPLASHSKINGLEKSGHARIGGSVTTVLRFWKASVAVVNHPKAFFFNRAVRGPTIVPYPFINFL